MIVIWVVLALILITGLCNAIAGTGGSPGSTQPADRGSNESSDPSLFADASNGIQQWVGGDTMPLGAYDFDCSRGGNVSIQLGQPPYTVALAGGDQTRQVGAGDLVTAGFCKVYGPK